MFRVTAPTLLALVIFSVVSAAFRLDLSRHEVVKARNYNGGIQKWNATKKFQDDNDPRVNYLYTANIYIGTPPQTFTVMLDQRMPFLWVPDATCGKENCPAFCKDPTTCSYLCHNSCCTKTQRSTASRSSSWCEKGVRKFDSSRSTTYRKNGTAFNIEFYEDSVDGFLGVDTITLGDSLTVQRASFGQAKSAAFDLESRSNEIYDGVLGLSTPVKYLGELPTGFEPPLLTAYNRGQIKQAIYTLYLAPLGSAASNAGRITYGALDSANCASDVKWVKTDGSGAADWMLNTKSLSIGGTTVSAAGQEYNVFSAYIDFTNRFALQAPKEFIDPLAKAVGAVYDFRGGYDIACDAKVPPLQFEFGGPFDAVDSIDKKFNVSASELVVKAPFGGRGCKLNIAVGGFDFTNPPVFNVGAPLMRTYCTVFDTLGKGRVGFAGHSSR